MAILLSLLISSLVRAALSSCQDAPHYSSLCAHYAGQELCQSYSTYLSVLCPASCSLCPRCDCEVSGIDLPAGLH